MKQNVGGIDRILRIVLGLALLGAGLVFKSWWGLIGLSPLFTGVFGWCPAYIPFGINTCPLKSAPKQS